MNKHLSQLIQNEYERQQNTLSLIPSENYVSPDVQKAQASCFTNKYSEGYPGKRYYGGTTFADELELLCQQQAQAVFNTDYYVNVQSYSGSPANLAACLALINPGDTIMGLNLSAGGHLTHGHYASFTGKIFKSIPYDVDPATQTFNYDYIEKLATEHKPKIIMAGTTAYSRTIDFAKFAHIAKQANAFLVADISHISGLVATGLHPSPFDYADIITTTTHKMLRGPRGALIFSKSQEIADKVNKSVFPGLQGGPHLHTIAAITQSLYEAQTPEYSSYCQSILDNAQAMVAVFKERGFNVITDGTDTHLWLLDLRSKGLTGTEAQEKLETHGIVANKNSIPHDTASPFNPSGLRLGTPALTTRGFTLADCRKLAHIICDLLEGTPVNKAEITQFINAYPIPTSNLA